MTPLTLSVILPNYNHAKYLPACLDSLLKQTLMPLEIVILDDASTDNSVEIIEQYARNHPVIKLHKSAKNGGVNQRMNQGLELVKGDYVYFCAADDIVLPQLFEKSLALLAQHKEAALCFSDPASFTEDEKGNRSINKNKMGLSDAPTYFPPDQLVELARRKRVLISGMSVMNKSAVLESGCFLSEFKWHSDFFLIFSMVFRRGACYIPEPLNLWRVTPGSYLSAGLRDRKAQSKVVHGMLDLLQTEKYRDVLGRFERSGVLAWAPRATFTILGNRKYWSFFKWALLRQAVVADIFFSLPLPVQNLIRRLRSKSS